MAFGLTTNKKKEAELKQLREELSAQIAEKEAELNSIRNALEEAEKKYSEKSASFSALEEQYENLKNEHTTLLGNPELAEKIAADSRVADLQEKLKKAKKELEDTEDELEEAEDELKDEKKRFDKKKADFDELQEKFYKLEKELNSNKEKLEEKEQKEKELSDALSVKNGSLDFVREILTAKSVSDSGETRKLYDSIYDAEQYICGEFYDCNKELFEEGEYSDYIFGYGLYHWAALEQKQWLKNKTTVAFVGEFSAGKTSIVNKILSHGGTNLTLPVSTKATTAVPTYISGSQASSVVYNFFTPDNELKVLSEKTFKRVDKGVLAQVEGISNLVKYFVMNCNNPNLENLSILDTPGFSSNDKEDAERTAEVINECDALFWVFDVNAGTVNRSSLKIIKEKLQKPLFVVINKVDTKAKSEVDKVEKLLKKTFSEEKINVEQFLRFSNREDPKSLLNALASVPRSNNSSYVSDILEFAEERLKVLVKDLQDKAKAEKNSNSRLDSARDAVQDKLGEIQSRLAEITGNAYNAKSIVRNNYREHFFASNKYELEASSANTFFGYVDDIMDESDALYNNRISELIDCVNEWNDAGQQNMLDFQAKSSAKSNKKRYEDCVKTLKKLLAGFSEGVSANIATTNTAKNINNEQAF